MPRRPNVSRGSSGADANIRALGGGGSGAFALSVGLREASPAEREPPSERETDFINMGKALNGISILANSLNHKEGGDIANNLVELYDYCRRNISGYVQDKDLKKLDEVYSIIDKLSEGWKAIDPKTKS